MLYHASLFSPHLLFSHGVFLPSVSHNARLPSCFLAPSAGGAALFFNMLFGPFVHQAVARGDAFLDFFFLYLFFFFSKWSPGSALAHFVRTPEQPRLFLEYLWYFPIYLVIKTLLALSPTTINKIDLD